MSTSGFSLVVYKVNFSRWEKIYRCRREWLWNTHLTLTSVIVMNAIRRGKVYCRQQCSSIFNIEDTNRK